MSEPAPASAGGTLQTLGKLSPVAIREELLRLVALDLEGPAGGAEEQIDPGDYPLVRERYVVGCLAPREVDLTAETGGFDELGTGDAGDPQDGAPEDEKKGARAYIPSSFGLSCTIDRGVEAIRLNAGWGRYVKREIEGPDGTPMRVWQRIPVEDVSPPMALVEGELRRWQPAPHDQPEVFVRGIARRLAARTGGDTGDWVVSLFLVNGQTPKKRNADDQWLFQAKLAVEGVDGDGIFVRRRHLRDRDQVDPAVWREDRLLAMAYRHQVEFATGHGVAVHATVAEGDPTRGVRVETATIPRYDLPRTDVPTAEDNPDLASLELDMKALAEAADGAALQQALASLPRAYERWVARQRDRVAKQQDGLAEFQEEAGYALHKAEEACRRIGAGLELLASDAQAADAFRFANRAMWQQRVHTIYAEAVRRGQSADLAAIDIAQNRSWRPFQLAFILLNLPSVTQLDHPDRSDRSNALVDLLWFPAGGGKTEAYLGLTAYTMALRRLQGVVGGRDGRAGVAVLMRYTLRLLTLQQFQRASALICAAELIRRESIARGEGDGAGRWGEEPFRIGLWVGARTTPNWVEDADQAIKAARGNTGGYGGFGYGSPAQLTTCPWCGSRLEGGRDIAVEKAQAGRLRVITYCSDPLGRCPFSRAKSPGEGVPVMVVDEEIYRRLPTLVIATVDKFAQLAWKGEVQMLFGQVDGWCPRHGYRAPSIEDSDSHPARSHLPAVKSKQVSPLRPPDLIIQDELHLISGPLGTLVGLYETAIDELCSWEVDGRRVRPKVVASTATIRQAQDQVKSLFCRRVAVFPPQGLEANDNFFAIQRQPSEATPGRAYVGVCTSGRRLKKALIRTYTAFLAAGQYLYETRGLGADADPWMTLVGYFNAMRELGGMRRLVEDDIRAALRDTTRRGLAYRSLRSIEELTSRKQATEIPKLLDAMELAFDPVEDAIWKKEKRRSKPTPLDVLLATNMVSVGVDVQRLGLMIVAGQPKTTAEYIQASSRVGRRHPGVVCTVYNWARPRDLSHYESFEHYHATFYQHVEGLSVTPFSPRALDRGLTGVLVSLIRAAGFEYNENKDAGRLERKHPLVRAAVDAILDRDSHIADPDARANVRAMLDRRLDEWLNRIVRGEGSSRLGYQGERDGRTVKLLEKPGLGRWETFTCPNSLREVEPAAGLVLNPSAIFDEAPATGGEAHG